MPRLDRSLVLAAEPAAGSDPRSAAFDDGDGDWRVLPAGPGAEEPDHDDAPWQRLLGDVGWEPTNLAWDGEAVTLRVRCGPQPDSEWHRLVALPDGRVLQSAHALTGDFANRMGRFPIGCFAVASAARRVHRVWSRLRRLERPGDWQLPPSHAAALPVGPSPDALNDHLALDADSVALARVVGLPGVRPGHLLGRVPSDPLLGYRVLIPGLWDCPPPAVEAAEARECVLEGTSGVRLLWRYGIHPGLVVALHRALGGDPRLPAVAYAALVLPRGASYGSGPLPPMPVPWLRRAADEPDLGDRAAALTALALQGLPSDEADPAALLGWLRSPLLATGDGWPRLHARGVTLQDVQGWALAAGNRTLPEYVRWLSTYPIAGTGDPWPGDVVDTILQDAIQAVRSYLDREEDLRDFWGGDDMGQEGWETLECLDHAPMLLDAIESGDPAAMLAAAEASDRMHTYYRVYKNYRYHLDACPVSDLARLVLGLHAWPDTPADAYRALVGGANEEDVYGPRYPAAACQGMWLALTYRDGLLLPPPHVDEARWEPDAEDPGKRPRTTFAEIVRAAVQAGPRRAAQQAAAQ